MENFFVKNVSTYSTSELQFWRRENDKFYENPQFFILFADFTKKKCPNGSEIYRKHMERFYQF